MQKVLIIAPEQHLARIDEVYDLTFNTISVPFIEDIQKKLIRNKISENGKFQVESIESRSGELIVQIKIIKNPFPLALAIGAVSTAVIGLLVFLTLGKVEQIINTPEGKTNAFSSMLGIAAGILGLGFLFKK